MCRSISSTALQAGRLMPRHKSLRSQLYRAAGDMGNVEVAGKGLGAYGKCVVRRRLCQSTNKVTGGFLRRLA
jgi:hypothetical protein